MKDSNHLLLLLYLLLSSLYQIILASSLSTPSKATHLPCLDHQRSALAQLQENLVNHTFFESSDSIAEFWDLKTDCCSWKGVACDDVGHVTQLNLSRIHQEHNWLTLHKPNLETLLQNLSFVEELNLDNIDLSAQGSNWCEVISHALPNLRVLSLSSSFLVGSICSSLSELRFLSELNLNNNFNLPSIPPNFLLNSSNLVSLDLSSCDLAGSFPTEIFLLPKLRYLDVSLNPKLSGQLPEFSLNSSIEYLSLTDTIFYGKLPWSISELKSLRYLDLSGCKFSGVIPSSLANLTHLHFLFLDGNSFSGSIPPFQRDGVPKLAYLSFSNNQFNGILCSSLFTLPSLQYLDLSRNQFSSELNEFPNASSSLIQTLDLKSNNLRGSIPTSIFELPRLVYLDLGNNNFSGSVNLQSFQNQRALEELRISGVSVQFGNQSYAFVHLQALTLSSCNLTEFPKFLKAQKSLADLDLSSNQIQGSVPSWIWNMSLQYLNLSNNHLEFLDQFSTCTSIIETLDLHANLLRGSFPKGMCNFSRLSLLDVSSNLLGGRIPDCFVNNLFLSVLNLQGNKFNGIPSFSQACNFQSLKIGGNEVQGKLPRSLAHCSNLQVLDLGENMIRDTFPVWLDKLPTLKILVLRGNQFYGPIGHLGELDGFRMLHVLDLSSNEFTGHLTKEFVQSFAAMQVITNKESKARYVGDDYMSKFFDYQNYYKDSVTIVNKGMEMHMERIVTIFTCLDLSQNRFHGEIPEEIGFLQALKVLNLSHNSFTGKIPSLMSNLTQLESLDLSKNQLSGEIPPQLKSLTFLAVMNLSYNQLERRIPDGNQFGTFSNASYEGNPRLCGPPLTRKCNPEVNDQPVAPPVDNEDSWNKYALDWKIVGMGYGSGLVIGFSIGYTIFSQMRIKWFTDLERRARKYGRRFRHGPRRKTKVMRRMNGRYHNQAGKWQSSS